jgi:hypothetical protein
MKTSIRIVNYKTRKVEDYKTKRLEKALMSTPNTPQHHQKNPPWKLSPQMLFKLSQTLFCTQTASNLRFSKWIHFCQINSSPHGKLVCFSIICKAEIKIAAQMTNRMWNFNIMWPKTEENFRQTAKWNKAWLAFSFASGGCQLISRWSEKGMQQLRFDPHLDGQISREKAPSDQQT